jgi:AraC-like DNA-binding protein
LLFSMIILGIVWPITVWWPRLSGIDSDLQYYPIELFLVLFIYWVALTGYHRTQLIYVRATKSASALPDQEEAGRYLALLKQAMEVDRLYLDPDLSLAKVGRHTTIPAKTISAILNQYEQQSFNDFINAYRVREVQARLLQPESRHLTISGVALDAGFNSQATFQRAFKNFTGMTPREWSTVHSPRYTVNGSKG